MTDRDLQLSLRALCQIHFNSCTATTCFWKYHLLPSYFCVLPELLEGDCVPDSLQPGHGLKLQVPHSYLNYFTQKNGLLILCCCNLKSGYLKVSCSCNSPGAHLGLFEALCEIFNRRMLPADDSDDAD